jgi:type III restriction enzyme
MKLPLKDFQLNTTDRLHTKARAAMREAEHGYEQAVVLASPTGSGKTIIATALMERIVQGDEDYAPDDEALFLWLSDQPDLNEQSRRKILAASGRFGADDLVTIDSAFDQERLSPGKVYFLNIQKLGRGSHLVTPGDERQFTIWQTVSNTVEAIPGSFWLILDEAHKGMLGAREAEQAATIAQKFIKGSAGEIPPIPLILGISATPDRFVELLRDTSRTQRPEMVNPEEVRASGLLKETIVLYHPTKEQPSDWTLLRASAEKLLRYREQWAAYCKTETEPVVDPVLVVQVEDTGDGRVTRTDLHEAVAILEDVIGPLSDSEIAHSFQEGYTIPVAERALRYVSPADIQEDENLRVVFFKLSLNTGWDCPRAEVIMSFRRALDYTRVAQLVGRLVRTPLARTVHANDFLNSVALYLPHYDRRALNTVIDYLTKPDTGVAAPPDIVEGEDLVEFTRDPEKADLFDLAETLPTYTIEHIGKASNVRRLIRLGRALAYDRLDAKAFETFRALIVSTLHSERRRLEKTAGFKQTVKERAEIDVRAVRMRYGVGAIPEETLEAVAAVSQNIEDLYAQCGRKLGEGLHAAYLKARVAEGSVGPPQAKLELATLLDDDKTLKSLEDSALTVFQEHMEKHRPAISHLPEARREAYRKLRRQAATPEPEELELPKVYEASRGDCIFSRHLYVAAEGLFACKLNDWESSVVGAELENVDVLGWFRNPPRKAWAFTVPYSYGSEERAMYPDFLVFRRQGEDIVVDILEPHWLKQDDAIPKAKGLANFAQRHGDRFGRIQLITRPGDKLLRLDLNREDIRDKVLNLTNNQQLAQLYESDA